MMKNIFLILIIFTLYGCSYISNLVIYNSSSTALEICNLVLDKTECVTVEPNRVNKIRLVSSQGLGLKYLVTTNNISKIYTVNFTSNFNYLSKVYCKKTNRSFCDVAIQYNSDQTFTWVGRNERHPVKNLPDQPIGFPLKPDA